MLSIINADYRSTKGDYIRAGFWLCLGWFCMATLITLITLLTLLFGWGALLVTFLHQIAH